ncbi:MAG TPA: hypothetical protein VD930_01125, partial [Gemmatimonadales bacterium]|nr:hypothetical protein [Gemmatimonadales bacterium]
MQALSRRISILAFALGAAACGDDDSFSPTVETVAGSYTATTFTLSSVVGEINLLSGGATVTMDLATDGTTTGRLFVPDVGTGGSDLEEDLAGTWSLTDSTVTFDQSEATFIPQIDFTASPNRLTGEGTFSGGTLRLVLTKE